MTSRPGSPIASNVDDESVANDIPDTAPTSFTEAETKHALDLLLANPAKYLSGNGFKSKRFTDISTSLKNKYPSRPVRKKETVGNRPRYVSIHPHPVFSCGN
ncbi:hypothetical protein B0H13DRAFT_2307118 [Mycena leptocephala]|nr:hypothetical protein B0H13DRAFT_2307118 [Mycena leptocephala]